MNYIQKYYKEFLPQIMMNLKLYKDTRSEEDQDPVFSSSESNLFHILEVLGDDSIDISTDFIESIILSLSVYV